MARRRRGQPVHGWVVLDKPVGLTSTAAVREVRRLFEAAKCGHAGTLDPLASGVLPIALGEATKVVSRVVEAGKRYRFTVRWGEQRDTDDAEGKVIARSDLRVDRAAIEAALGAFIGEIAQVPPVYSALKVDGERAYDLAREGRPADLPARPVRIDSIALIACPDADRADFSIECGKGAYVRALARDLGRDLGCLGHVSALRRSAVGGFDEAMAISLDQLRALRHKGALAEALLPIETALDDIPALAVTVSEASRLKCGQRVRVPQRIQGDACVMAAGKPIALAHVEDGEVRPVRVFNL